MSILPYKLYLLLPLFYLHFFKAFSQLLFLKYSSGVLTVAIDTTYILTALAFDCFIFFKGCT